MSTYKEGSRWSHADRTAWAEGSPEEPLICPSAPPADEVWGKILEKQSRKFSAEPALVSLLLISPRDAYKKNREPECCCLAQVIFRWFMNNAPYEV